MLGACNIVEGEGNEWLYYSRKMPQHSLQKPYSVTLSVTRHIFFKEKATYIFSCY
jgi:hypothetical protein